MLVCKGRVRSQANPCEICGGQRGRAGAGFSPSTSAPYSSASCWSDQKDRLVKLGHLPKRRTLDRKVLSLGLWRVVGIAKRKQKFLPPPPHTHTCSIMEMHLFFHRSSVHFAQPSSAHPIHYSQHKPTDTRRQANHNAYRRHSLTPIDIK